MAVHAQSVWSSPAEPEALQPFRFRGGTRGCLLLHGFAGTPPEMRGLGQFLAAGGYDVMGPLLAGHGLTPEAMASTRWPDWVRSAEDALRELRRDCQEVFVGGQSLGATLALHLAATQPDVRGVFTMGAMSSPAYFRDWRIKAIRGLKYVVRWHTPDDDDCDLGDPSALRLLHSYARRPTVCIESLMQLLRVVDRELPRINAPALITHGRRDRTVDVANAPHIVETIASIDKRLVWFERSGHAITVDLEHGALYRTVLDWLNTH
jgi:carboxylesterase